MKKQIAFIHGPLVVGGAEKALINMLRFFDYSRYDVTLWLKNNSGLMEDQVDPRVTIRYWDECLNPDYKAYISHLLMHGRLDKAAHSLRYRLLSRKYLHNWHKNYMYYIKSLPLLSDKEYDVAVSYHSLVKEDLMVLDYAIRAKKKIGWIHGICRHRQDDPYFESFSIEYRKLDHIFCVSLAAEKAFLEKYPELQMKTSVMYNLQNFNEIRRLAKEQVPEPFEGFTLVTVGRLAEEKGQTMIPEIARRLLETGHKFTWYIVGDGQTRQTIEEEIIRLGIENTVKLLGNRLNPYPYISRASLYVQPSFSEGFCVTTFEAKILNTPVVTTDVAGMREQFSEQEAIFCAPDPESITTGIEYVIQNMPLKKCEIPENYNVVEMEKLFRILEE